MVTCSPMFLSLLSCSPSRLPLLHGKAGTFALLLAAVATTSITAPTVAAAQTSQAPVSREVIQQLPSRDVQQLNRALQRLARDPRNVDALVNAGDASLKLDDLDAAMGFFGRAQSLSPNNARAKLGRAAVFLRSERPIEALRIYAEAEAKGISTRSVAADRGLAFDLAGNNAEAQLRYRAALVTGRDDEVSRRLAISQAISGDEDGFEQTLLPMLERGDLAAFRARAFGLAILGKTDQATSISDAVMPRDLASRIAPYLAYMPRLTASQQAAAANLGIFPQAAEIGRDDPQIARYAQSVPARQAPSGAAAPVANVDARLAPQGERLGRSPGSANPVASPAPPRAPSASRLAAVAQEQASAQAVQSAPRPASAPTATNRPPENLIPQPRVEDAFADMARPAARLASAPVNGVDITSITPPREVEAPPAPVYPSRHWVQVATGQDRSALRFDWRRMARNSPDLLGDFDPHVVRWGQANRLLAGPVDSPAAARALVNALKAQGQDSFPYTNPEGEEIVELQ